MSYQNNQKQGGYRQPQAGGNNKPAYGNNKTAATTASGSDGKKSEAILTKFLKPTKSGKSIGAFTVGDQALVIPANTRVVVTALSDKRMAALEKAGLEKGFKGPTPTYELAVFKIEPKA